MSASAHVVDGQGKAQTLPPEDGGARRNRTADLLNAIKKTAPKLLKKSQ
jgi:hypothetical protein